MKNIIQAVSNLDRFLKALDYQTLSLSDFSHSAIFLPLFLHRPPASHHYNMKTMDVKIALFERGLMATFSVEQITITNFIIRLKSFDGEIKPPLYIKISRSDLGWTSAFEDNELVREIGMAIDRS
jgi:hypothetical protein